MTTNPHGTLILHCGEERVQYSLTGVQADFISEPHEAPRVELSANLGGGHLVDLGPSSEVLDLLLELYVEQALLGAGEEALANTRERIKRHVKKEAA